MARIDADGLPSLAPAPDAGQPYQRVHADPIAFGGGVAQGLQNLGQNTEKAADDVFRSQMLYEDVTAEDAANQYQDRVSKLLNGDPDDPSAGPGYMNTRGSNAMEGRPGLDKQLDKLTKETSATLKSPRAQKKFGDFALRHMTATRAQISQHADQESQVWYGEVNQNTEKLALNNIAANPNDEAQVLSSTSDIIGARIKQVQLKGGPKEAISEAAASAQRDALTARVQAIAVNDPMRAMKLLDDNRAQAGLNYDQLANGLRARVDDVTAVQDANKYLSEIDNPLAPGTSITPRADKAARLLDQAQAMEKINTDYKDNPVLGEKVRRVVNERYTIAKMEVASRQLARQEATTHAMRGIGDAIWKDPSADIEPALQNNPALTQEQVEHLRELRLKTLNERLKGGPDGWGPGAASVQSRLFSTGPDKIVNSEQLLPLVADGTLNPAGHKALTDQLAEINKPGAEAEKVMQSNFYASAKKSVTLEFEGEENSVSPDRRKAWDEALPVLNRALAEGRAKGLTNAQMMNPKSKDSVWSALDTFLPTKAEQQSAEIMRDNKQVKFDIGSIKTSDDAVAALRRRDITRAQAMDLVRKNPNWGIRLPAAPAQAPRVPTDGGGPAADTRFLKDEDTPSVVKDGVSTPVKEEVSHWDQGFVNHLNAEKRDKGAPRSLSYAIKYFADKAEDPERKNLANLLAEKIGRAGDDKFTFIPQANLVDGVNGLTKRQDGKIAVALHPDQINQDTALHETTHAVLMNFMDKMEDMGRGADHEIKDLPTNWSGAEKTGAKAVFDVFERAAKVKYDGVPPVWLSEARKDPNEFLARAMTDKNFQEWMRKQPVTADKSMWDKFVDGTKKIIFGEAKATEKERNLLEDALDAGFGLIGALE